MPEALVRVVLLVLFLASLGCETLEEPPPPPPDRKDLHPTSHEGIHPGFSGTWQVLPRGGSPRQGVLDLFLPDPPVRAGDPSVGGADEAAHEAAGMAAGESVGGSTGRTHAGPLAAAEPARPRRRRRAEGVLSIDADYRASLGGEDDEFLAGPDYVEWDGIRILPRQELRYGFDQHLATLDVRGGGRFFETFSIEALAGLTVSALHLTVRGAGIRTGETTVGLGPNVGARLSVAPHRVANLYAQGQLHVLGSVQEDHRATLVKTAEVGGQLHVTSALSVFAGYRWTAWDQNVHKSSDVRMDLSGPTFGVLLRQ